MDDGIARDPSAAGRAFLATMPAAVARQRDLLGRLLDAVAQDPTYRWLELGCSLARGAGDELSDIDAAVGVVDEAWPAAVGQVADLLATLRPGGESTFRQRMPAGAGTMWHLFTLYADGTQLSLVVMPASWRPGLPPQAVALYDPDGRLARPWEPAALTADEQTVREWIFSAWVALGDLAKYLDRGSLWEAHARLEEARQQIWRVQAYVDGLEYPGFGLMAVLDADHPRLPTGIEHTVAGLSAAELRAAALEAEGVLREVAAAATSVSAAPVAPSVPVAPVTPELAEWVGRRLRQLS